MSVPNEPHTALPARGREQLPDQLRGLALLGIVLVNMPFLALSNAGFTAAATTGVADQVTEFVIVAFAQGKFYLMFAFLFGYSLTLMLRRPTGDGLRRYRRRLVGLAVLGVLHATLFFVGDILVSYAVLGLVLLWLAPRPDRAALRVASASLCLGALVLVLVVIAARTASLPGVLIVLGVLNWWYALAMFCLGLVAGRRGILARPHEHTRLWRGLTWAALAVGAPTALISAALTTGADDGSLAQTAGIALGFLTAPFLTGGYVALAARCTDSWLLRTVAPAGRMSLTGYLGESILLSAIFSGWGLGWFGQLGAFTAALVAVAVWLSLELFARLWLQRFAYGPFEWILRAWTYRAWPPRRSAATAYGAAGGPQ